MIPDGSFTLENKLYNWAIHNNLLKCYLEDQTTLCERKDLLDKSGFMDLLSRNGTMSDCVINFLVEHGVLQHQPRSELVND
jgi:hypothetical protein